MEQTKAKVPDNGWTEKDIKEFPGSPFARIGDEWMLISAGNGPDGNWNTMTASWGGLGVLWRKNVAFVFVRKSRHTLSFMNSGTVFSLSFFDPSFRKALAFCGAHSGRDYDKAKETGLSPLYFSDGTVGFAEASDVISCRKLYTHDFEPEKFLDPGIDGECYPDRDYHRLFIGEVIAYRTRPGKR
jgi:flavin reductase (DIM6/NTAB) family NADH-FMN oxidoreductase RutF